MSNEHTKHTDQPASERSCPDPALSEIPDKDARWAVQQVIWKKGYLTRLMREEADRLEAAYECGRESKYLDSAAKYRAAADILKPNDQRTYGANETDIEKNSQAKEPLCDAPCSFSSIYGLGVEEIARKNDENWDKVDRVAGEYHCESCGVLLNDGETLIAGGVRKWRDDREDQIRTMWTCYYDGCRAKAEEILYPKGYPKK